jgi:competence protein ComEA
MPVGFPFGQHPIPEPETSRCPPTRIVVGMKRTAIFVLTVTAWALTACTTQQRSPEEIRKDTASATSTAARDAKAVAEGVVDGLKKKGPVNINKASEKELETLPGIDDAASRKIIDNRPYDSPSDLVKKHAVSGAEYDRIADKIAAQ